MGGPFLYGHTLVISKEPNGEAISVTYDGKDILQADLWLKDQRSSHNAADLGGPHQPRLAYRVFLYDCKPKHHETSAIQVFA